jgi:hypothetical protein
VPNAVSRPHVLARALEDLIASKVVRLDPRDKMFVEAIHAQRPLDLDLVERRIGEIDLIAVYVR